MRSERVIKGQAKEPLLVDGEGGGGGEKFRKYPGDGTKGL